MDNEKRNNNLIQYLTTTMEKIKIILSNGRAESFITSENETYKFYRCETYNNAIELSITLTEIGNHCEIGEDNHGWFVRVKK